MRIRYALVVMTLALLTSVTLTTAAAQTATPAASPAVGAPITLTLVERDVHTTTVDRGPSGPSVGDVIIWGPNPFYDATNTANTGATTQGSCIVFDPAGDCLATATIVFPDGSTLQIQGIEAGATIASTRAIIGGSGRYRGATGTETVLPSADRSTWRSTLAIWL